MNHWAASRLLSRFPPTLVLLTALVLGAALACGGSGGNDTGASPKGSSSSKRITFMAGFKPQANLPFVGAYVAQEKGFFKDLDLHVDIRHAQSGEHLQLLLAGEVQVATANAAQVVQRAAEGLPVVSIALVGQKSEQGFAVGVNSGINSIADWKGKRFGYKGTVPVEFLAIARANNLNPNDVDQVRVSFDPRVLSEGQVDILAVFFSNEPGQLERLGYRVRVFDPSDYNIPVLGLTYIASQDGLKKDPEALERFLRGALKGIEYAANNVEETLDIIMKYAPQEDREQQRFMLTTELARARTPLTTTYGYGWQTREQWSALVGALREFNIIDRDVDVSKVFSAQLLEKIRARRD